MSENYVITLGDAQIPYLIIWSIVRRRNKQQACCSERCEMIDIIIIGNFKVQPGIRAIV